MIRYHSQAPPPRAEWHGFKHLWIDLRFLSFYLQQQTKGAIYINLKLNTEVGLPYTRSMALINHGSSIPTNDRMNSKCKCIYMDDDDKICNLEMNKHYSTLCVAYYLGTRIIVRISSASGMPSSSLSSSCGCNSRALTFFNDEGNWCRPGDCGCNGDLGGDNV